MTAKTTCPHCRKPSDSGTHNGCYECGRVKHTYDGRRKPNTKG